MAKWIKIHVPETFDVDRDRVQIICNESVNGEARISQTVAEVWKTQYRQILDHGFIGLVDFLGDDDTVVAAARLSYMKHTRRVNEDPGLIRYLLRHEHMTPFEMCEFLWHVKLPIFVERQWIRHRTANVNEMSARYSVLDSEMYMPDHAHCTPQARDNKQGRSDTLLSESDYKAVTAVLEHCYENAYQGYEHILGPMSVTDDKGKPVLKPDGTPMTVQKSPPDNINERRLWLNEAAINAIQKVRAEQTHKAAVDPEFKPTEWTEDAIAAKVREYYEANNFAMIEDDFPGIARELARLTLPLATYTQKYWKCDLRNTFHFMGLRSDPHAQYEVRVYSDAMMDMLAPFVPWCLSAFMDYHMNAVRLSRFEVGAVRDFLNRYRGILGENTFDADIEGHLKQSGASKREISEFMKRFVDVGENQSPS